MFTSVHTRTTNNPPSSCEFSLKIGKYSYYEIGSFSEDFWGKKRGPERGKAARLIRKLKVPRKNGFLFRIPSIYCSPNNNLLCFLYLTLKIRQKLCIVCSIALLLAEVCLKIIRKTNNGSLFTIPSFHCCPTIVF